MLAISVLTLATLGVAAMVPDRRDDVSSQIQSCSSLWSSLDSSFPKSDFPELNSWRSSVESSIRATVTDSCSVIGYEIPSSMRSSEEAWLTAMHSWESAHASDFDYIYSQCGELEASLDSSFDASCSSKWNAETTSGLDSTYVTTTSSTAVTRSTKSSSQPLATETSKTSPQATETSKPSSAVGGRRMGDAALGLVALIGVATVWLL
jgi:hypothetical protein